MKKVALLILLVGFVNFSANAQSNSETELVIIRVVEVNKGVSSSGDPVVHITENDSTYRIIELAAYPKRYLQQDNDAQRIVHTELKRYLSTGYKIEGHTKGVAGSSVWFENFVLVKN